MNDYKQEIIESRVGALGSSDGKLLQLVATLGYVPQSARKRLAVAKGLAENEQIPYTAAVRAGDAIEMAIYEYLTENDDRYQSNPLLVSEKFSRKNIRLIDHPDIFLLDEKNKTIFIYEVKTTKNSVEQTRSDYRAQLYIHTMQGKEMACKRGRGWKVKVALVHYDTNGLDLENGVEFDPSRLTLHNVVFNAAPFDLAKAMDIIDGFLETFNEYYPDGEVPYDYLPVEVKQKFDAVAEALAVIKEKEASVNEFKEKLYDFLVEKNIKGIRSDAFTITRVDPTVSKSFDYKRFLDDYAAEHPTKHKRLVLKYEKTTNKRGYVTIKLK